MTIKEIISGLNDLKADAETHRESDETIEDVFQHDIDVLDAAVKILTSVNCDPVRHGEWKDRYNNGDWHCTVCGAIVEKDEQIRHNWYRCYYCGAKMDGGISDGIDE